jgi:hypothetical protein
LIAFDDATASGGDMSHILASSYTAISKWTEPTLVLQYGFTPPDLAIDDLGNGAIAYFDLSVVNLVSIDSNGAFSQGIFMAPFGHNAEENNFRFGKSPSGN